MSGSGMRADLAIGALERLMLRGELVHLQHVVGGVRASEEIGIAPHHVVECHDAAELDPGLFVRVAPREMGRDASQHLDDLLFLGVWHSDLTWCCNICLLYTSDAAD